MSASLIPEIGGSMIYRLDSGVDTEIKEKIITIALILAATIGIPALAAVIK